jgi:aspartyl-tRNA(Asn)/glutamyl-tRNA(Gln) amidotransferase subunit A
MDICELSITETHKGLVEKKFSSLDITKAYLKKIKSEDKKISAFLEITEDLALSQAKEADELKEISPLTGIPCAIKDLILIKGTKTTCASKILKDYVAPYDATCIKNLKKENAVFLGKTNLDEFAMGTSTENSAFFPTKNPADLKRVPGGSSGGSAAAVAANMCCYALGSDTGGSIRQPASFCGVVGLKPTYGAVSRYGLVAFASSLDQIGPITKTVEDAETVFKAISSKDKMDSTSIGVSELNAFNKPKRLGIPKEYFIEGINPEVKKAVEKAIKKFNDLGIKTEEISLPHTKYAIPVYYLTCTSEASSNLARYDGIKYGSSEKEADDLMDVYLKTRGKGFGEEVKRRIMLGTYALSAGYYDAYYLKAQKMRTLLKQDFEKAFEKVDAIVSPVTPTPAFKFGEKITDPLSMYLCDIFTASVNLTGLPAVSVPAGEAENLPIGMQIIGKAFEEYKILGLGKLFEL